MGTEVLRPHDCLVERFPPFNNNNTNFGYQSRPGYTKTNHINNNINYGYKKPSMVKTDHKKRYQNQNQNQQHQQHKDSTSPKKTSSPNDSRAVSRHTSNNRNDLEMGKVTIFMRGDSLDSLDPRIKKDRTKKTAFDHADLYAGSAISVSPSPSSLPLPSFFKKQELKAFDDSATRDLRRLLRLE